MRRCKGLCDFKEIAIQRWTDSLSFEEYVTDCAAGRTSAQEEGRSEGLTPEDHAVREFLRPLFAVDPDRPLREVIFSTGINFLTSAAVVMPRDLAITERLRP